MSDDPMLNLRAFGMKNPGEAVSERTMVNIMDVAAKAAAANVASMFGHQIDVDVNPGRFTPDVIGFPPIGFPPIGFPPIGIPPDIRFPPDIKFPDFRPPQPTREFDDLVDGIPVVNDGDVIYAAHYNALRAAIAVLASGLKQEGLGRVVRRSFQAALFPSSQRVGISRSDWNIVIGGNDAPKSSWMPLDLPDGTTIASMRVSGTGELPKDGIKVALTRMDLSTFEEQEMISGTLTKETTHRPTPEVFAGDVEPQVAILQKLAGTPRLVQTSRYAYNFVTSAAGDARVRLVEVTCTRG